MKIKGKVKGKILRRNRPWGLFEEGVASLTILLVISLILMVTALPKSNLSEIEVLSLMVFTVTTFSFALILYYMAVSDMFGDIVNSLLMRLKLPEDVVNKLQKVRAESSLVRRNFGILLLIVALSLKAIGLSRIPEPIKLVSLLIASSASFLFFLIKYDDMLNQYVITFNEILPLHSISPEDVIISIKATKRDLILRLIAILFLIGILSRLIIPCSDEVWSLVITVSSFISLIIFTNFNFLARSIPLLYAKTKHVQKTKSKAPLVAVIKSVPLDTPSENNVKDEKDNKHRKDKGLANMNVKPDNENINHDKKGIKKEQISSSEEKRDIKPSTEVKITPPSKVKDIQLTSKQIESTEETQSEGEETSSQIELQEESIVNEEEEGEEESLVSVLFELESELKKLRNRLVK